MNSGRNKRIRNENGDGECSYSMKREMIRTDNDDSEFSFYDEDKDYSQPDEEQQTDQVTLIQTTTSTLRNESNDEKYSE